LEEKAMEDLHIARNNDMGKQTLGRQSASDNRPGDLSEDDTLRVDLCRVAHNCPPCPYRRVGQESDDVGSKPPLFPTHDSSRQESSHMLRNVPVESATRSQSHGQGTLPEFESVVPVPCPAFAWYEPDPFFYVLYFQGKFAEISIIDPGMGIFAITVGDYTLVDVPTLRQAQTICHHIAWTFKNSLPVPRNRMDYKPYNHEL
jgi:hypothetical protein